MSDIEEKKRAKLIESSEIVARIRRRGKKPGGDFKLTWSAARRLVDENISRRVNQALCLGTIEGLKSVLLNVVSSEKVDKETLRMYLESTIKMLEEALEEL